MRIIINEVGKKSVMLLMNVGDEKGGKMVLNGEKEMVEKIGKKVCEMINGKGEEKGKKFKDKV
jgi:hypothetical protein